MFIKNRAWRWRFSSLAVALLSAAVGQAVEFPSVNAAAKAYTNPDPQLQMMFRLALLNTGNQTEVMPDQTAYVKTGDISAEWLRDSSAQVRPYLFFAKSDPTVALLLKQVIFRQSKYMAIDPYSNAFRPNYKSFERKFELDSLAYPILLAWTYWKVTDDSTVFTDVVQKGFLAALGTMEREQDHDSTHPKYFHIELRRHEVGNTGMIWTGFRPSDDACYYNFLIPSEMLAVQALGALYEIETAVYKDQAIADRAKKLRLDVHTGIQNYGIINTDKYGSVYAYEVDGLGHANFMDDGNLPSLLAAPYFGYLTNEDPVYVNTRKMILSSDNPFFYSGNYASGIGSPHTPRGYVWPLALLAEGLTATNGDESKQMLKMLLASDPGDNQLHESFDPNNPKRYTRPNFGWPNALFAEFMMTKFNGVAALPLPSNSDLEFRKP